MKAPARVSANNSLTSLFLLEKLFDFNSVNLTMSFEKNYSEYLRLDNNIKSKSLNNT